MVRVIFKHSENVSKHDESGSVLFKHGENESFVFKQGENGSMLFINVIKHV